MSGQHAFIAAQYLQLIGQRLVRAQLLPYLGCQFGIIQQLCEFGRASGDAPPAMAVAANNIAVQLL